MKSLGKNIGLSILIVMAAALVLMIAFYNKISVSRIIPAVEEYALSEEAQNEVAEEDAEGDAEVIKTYKVKASDLNQYERTKEYNKGKQYPFSTSQTPDGATTGRTVGEVQNSNEDTDSARENGNSEEPSTNFYEDDGTK